MSSVGPHPFLHQGSVKILQRPKAFNGRDGRPFQEILQIMIMVVIQTTYRDARAVALQFSSHKAVSPLA
jgi:hypothetical protein